MVKKDARRVNGEPDIRGPGVGPYKSSSSAMPVDAQGPGVLAEQLPAFLAGADTPTDRTQRLAFAQMAYDAKQYACVARPWEAALEADAKIADEFQAQQRYNAACRAVLASSGLGNPVRERDEGERTKLRK